MDDRVKMMVSIDVVSRLAVQIRAAKSGRTMGEIVEDAVKECFAEELAEAKEAMKERKVKKV